MNRFSPPPREFSFPTGLQWPQLREALAARFTLEEQRPHTISFTYYDTFDWRLHERGQALRGEQQPDSRLRLHWFDGKHGDEIVATTDSPPGFRDALPRRLQPRLAPLIEVRALLPQVQLHGPTTVCRILDDQDKTIAKLICGNWTVRCNRRTHGRIDDRVLLEPLRGYHEEAGSIARCLVESGAQVAPENLLTAALREADRAPGDYTSKLSVVLHRDQTALAATVAVLRYLLDVIRRNEAGVRADIDPEFLHDFRVAIRRTRSALSQVKGVFDPDAIAGFRTAFAWLAQQTGPKRDLDVHALRFASASTSGVVGSQRTLDALLRYLNSQRKQAEHKMNRTLASRRYHKLLENWEQFLDEAQAHRGPQADRPAADVARKRIWRVYRRVMETGAAIDANSPPAALHELRKTCKKLRYLMEFFKSLYPAGSINKRIKQLKQLQDNLGTFQDQTIQAEALQHFARDMAGKSAADTEILLEIGAMVEQLHQQQIRTRRAFADRFARFASPSNTKAFVDIFGPRG